MAFPNIYTHRKVADTASKPCDICFKPSTSVLVVPENKDFFFICPGHLKDKGFCTPIIDEAAVAAKKKKEMEDEVERVKKEFEEKQKKKKEKEKEKEKDKDKKDEDKKEKGDEKKDDDTKKPDTTSQEPEEEPRVFALQKAFYQKRLDRKRAGEIAKRNRERFQNPNLFPIVPKDIR
ncbi:hypothetical protein V501_02354 [Pseudogymnoascus sp. VKM F-4519 (FW-2642)]|nr:hypothetical protein V501_02354 [Pseudogymnoascus sp. VKM F-4519 (FW-2642)]